MLVGLIAQLVEQLTLNQLVVGSSPTEPKIPDITGVIFGIFVLLEKEGKGLFTPFHSEMN